MSQKKRWTWKLLLLGCVLSVLADLPLHRHSHFSENGIDGSLGFYAAMAFFGALVLLLLAKFWSLIVSVDGDYYDGQS